MLCENNPWYRKILLDKVQDIFPQFELLQDGTKFIKLMQCADSEMALIVGQFLKDSVKDRKQASRVS